MLENTFHSLSLITDRTNVPTLETAGNGGSGEIRGLTSWLILPLNALLAHFFKMCTFL